MLLRGGVLISDLPPEGPGTQGGAAVEVIDAIEENPSCVGTRKMAGVPRSRPGTSTFALDQAAFERLQGVELLL
jgi:hypothetical protein